MGKILTIILTPCWKEKSFPDLLPVAPPESWTRLKKFLFYSTCPPNRKNFYFFAVAHFHLFMVLRSLIGWGKCLCACNTFLEAPPSFGLPPNVGLFYKIFFDHKYFSLTIFLTVWSNFWKETFLCPFSMQMFYFLNTCRLSIIFLLSSKKRRLQSFKDIQRNRIVFTTKLFEESKIENGY